MTYERGRSCKKNHIKSCWLPSPETSPICVTRVVAMYATISHFSFLLPRSPNLPPSPTSLLSSLCAFKVAIRAFEYFASSSLHIVAPLAARRSVAAPPHSANSALAWSHPNTTHHEAFTVLQSCLFSIVTTVAKDTIIALLLRFTKMTTLTSMKSTRAHAQSFRLRSRIASPTHTSHQRSRIANLTESATSIYLWMI